MVAASTLSADALLTSDRSADFSYRDLELVHQWTCSTAESLDDSATLRQAMKEVVPRLAMTQPYLMYVAEFPKEDFTLEPPWGSS